MTDVLSGKKHVVTCPATITKRGIHILDRIMAIEIKIEYYTPTLNDFVDD